MSSSEQYIIDVGMNDGKDALYYAKRGYKVIGYEANPGILDEARKMFQENGVHVDVRNKAISDSGGELKFYVNKFNHTWSSLDQNLGARREGAEEILVPACNLGTDLAEISKNIHYVKIDIEGYDEVALGQVLGLPYLPRYISVENGSNDIIGKLNGCGYEKFKFSNQRYVSAQQIPVSSQHGVVFPHTFKQSSSGLFGEDLPGRWFTTKEALSVLDGLTYGRKVAANNLWAECVGWFDLHASL